MSEELKRHHAGLLLAGFSGKLLCDLLRAWPIELQDIGPEGAELGMYDGFLIAACLATRHPEYMAAVVQQYRREYAAQPLDGPPWWDEELADFVDTFVRSNPAGEVVL